MKKGIRYGLLSLILVLLGGVIAPFVSVDYFTEQIRLGLERSLHRRVEIKGDAHLNLFRGPGFSVEQVIIYDDPSAGIEPLADVPELQTTVSLISLWTRRLEFASVRFVEPKLNLVKPEQGTWNMLPLLAGAAAAKDGRLPEIYVSRGRIDFKFGDVKSPFYLTDTDLTFSPGTNGSEIRFSCAPARTDRVAQGYGLFTGRGHWAGGNIDLDVELEKSPLEELVTLVRGQSLGLHGMIQSRAKISGPLTDPSVTGRFALDDVHRWDLIPGRAGNWSMAYRGKLDTLNQSFRLAAERAENPEVPIELRLVVQGLLSEPNWSVEAAVDKLPAASLVEFARHMGAPLPTGIGTDGQVVGTVRYVSNTGMDGQLNVENAKVSLGGNTQFSMPSASLVIQGDEVRLLPAELSQQGNQALLELRYAPFRQQLEARLTGKGLRISDLQDGAGHLLNGMAVPLASRFKGGTWSGTVHYLSSGNQPGEWTANLQVRETATSVPGISTPVQIGGADVLIDGQRIEVHRMRAVAGDLEVYGEYTYAPDALRPHRFSITIPSADITEMEALLSPALQRSGGLLSRALRWRSPLPDWLRERRADGQLRIGTLTAGDIQLRGFRTRVAWTGSTVRLHGTEAHLEDGALTGLFVVDLSKADPRYTFTGTLQNLAWKGGYVDLDGSVETSGAGMDVLANLKAEGTFEAHAVAVSPDLALKSASGSFDMTVGRTGPQIHVSGLQAVSATERFSGEGATQPDGRVQVELASQTRSLKVDVAR